MIKKIYKASNAEQFHWGFRRSASWPTWFHSFSHSEIVYSSPTVCQAVWERELRPDQNVSFISDKKNSLKNVALDQGQDGLLIFHPWGLAKWVDNYSPFFLPPSSPSQMPAPKASCDPEQVRKQENANWGERGRGRLGVLGLFFEMCLWDRPLLLRGEWKGGSRKREVSCGGPSS